MTDLDKVRLAAHHCELAGIMLDELGDWNGITEDLRDIADALRCGANYLEGAAALRAARGRLVAKR